MKKILLAVCAVLGLAAACVPGDSPEYITYYLNKGFIGHPLNEFTYDYGYPIEGYDNAMGRMYRWSSVESPKGRHKTLTGLYTTKEPYEDHYHPSDNVQVTPDREYCELRIYTDKFDIIQGFRIAVDSIGKYSPSRCSELFKKVYP